MPQSWGTEDIKPEMPTNQQAPRLGTVGHLPNFRPAQDQQRPQYAHLQQQQRTAAPSGSTPNFANPAGHDPSYAKLQGQNPFVNPSSSHGHYGNNPSTTAGYAQPSGSNPNYPNPSTSYPKSSLPNGMTQSSPFGALPNPLPSTLQQQNQRQQQQQPPVNKPLPWMTQQKPAVPPPQNLQQQQPVKQTSRPTSAGSFMGMLTDGDNITAGGNRQQSPFQAGPPILILNVSLSACV